MKMAIVNLEDIDYKDIFENPCDYCILRTYGDKNISWFRVDNLAIEDVKNVFEEKNEVLIKVDWELEQ